MRSTIWINQANGLAQSAIQLMDGNKYEKATQEETEKFYNQGGKEGDTTPFELDKTINPNIDGIELSEDEINIAHDLGIADYIDGL